MISCRIVLNELPNDILEQMLCIDEVEPEDRRWQLIKRTAATATYRFDPKPRAKSWFVQWGHEYSWSHFKESIQGHDHATRNWEKTSAAASLGIHVMPYRLLATPRLLTGSLDTLLAREYLDNARSVDRFLMSNIENHFAIEDTLINLGELLGAIHARGLLHGRFDLDTILVQYEDPTRLAIIDWHHLQAAPENDTLAYREELAILLNDLIHIGLQEDRLIPLLHAYAARMPYAQGRADEILKHAAPEISKN